MPERPMSSEAHEMTVIGALLNADGKHHLILDTLTVDDFYFRQHRQAYEVLVLMYEGGQELPQPEEAQVVAESLALNKLNRRYWMNRYQEYRADPGREIVAVRRLRECSRLRSTAALASEVLSAVRDPLNFDPWTATEQAIAAWQGRETAAAPPPRAPLRDWMLDCDTAEPPWLIPGLMEREMRTTLIGDSGIGKTWISRQIALCASQGVHPFRPRTTFPKRKVLMVELENGPLIVNASFTAIRHRLQLWMRDREIEPDWGMIANYALDDPLRLDNPAEYRDLARLVAQVQPELIVLGPLYRMMSHGDRNPEGEATRMQQRLDDLRRISGAAILLEAHGPKGSNDSVRGSQAWTNWPDYGWSLIDKSPRDQPRTHLWVGATRGPRGEARFPSALQKDEQPLGSSKMPWYPVNRVSADA